MPNNPGTRRAGAVVVPAANKVQRGQAVARTVSAASAALLADQTAAAAGGGGGGGGGTGDVVGPAGAVANNFPSYNGVTGKLIKDSGKNAASFEVAGAAAAVSAALTPRVLPPGGSRFARFAKNSNTNYDFGFYGPQNFNVLDYVNGGAVSTDAAFTSAINDMIAAGGGTLRIPYNPTPGFNGVWFLSAALPDITVPCAIVGDGYSSGGSGGTMIIQTAANTTVFKIKTPSPCHMRNIALNGGGTQSTFILQGTTPGTDFNSATIISDCIFIGGNVGMDLDAGFLTIRGCLIDGAQYGIRATNTVNLDNFVGSICECSIGGTTACITADADGIQIIGNSFNRGLYGLIITSVAGFTWADLWFIGNHVEGVTVAGVRFDGNAAGCLFTSIIIDGNEFGGPATCIETNGRAAWTNPFLVNMTITGNILRGYATGINLFNCECISITGNCFDSVGGSVGVNVDATAANGSAGSTNRFRGGTTPVVNTGGFSLV